MSEARWFGVYRGLVSDTADPKRQNRLRVTVPAVNGEGDLGWAMPCFPLLTQQPELENAVATGGDAYHGGHPVTGKTKKITVRMPKKGTPVWVMFENGDARRPVWLGSWMGV